MENSSTVILSTSYLPPFLYIRKIAEHANVLLEAHEHFVKQTIRNRCHILSPNGIQQLIIPVIHKNRFRTPVKDLKISNDIPWQRMHWRSLQAAYQRSAFFEFYMDDFIVFYEKKFEFLFDFNTQLLQYLMEQLGIRKEMEFTEEYLLLPTHNVKDLRQLCNTGDPAADATQKSYPQVFSYKSGFVKGLSVVDLLFNTSGRSGE